VRCRPSRRTPRRCARCAPVRRSDRSDLITSALMRSDLRRSARCARKCIGQRPGLARNLSERRVERYQADSDQIAPVLTASRGAQRAQRLGVPSIGLHPHG